MDAAAQKGLERFNDVRRHSLALCRPLVTDDYNIQSMTDVSPPKWHLAHTTWFFEEFLLALLDPGYEPVHARYRYLFNSYYEAAGARIDRSRRGLLSRPSVEEIYAYRAAVERRVCDVVERASVREEQRALGILELGCHHEEQHQELLVTDIKHIFWSNPLRPSYGNLSKTQPVPRQSGWLEFPGGVREIGFHGNEFAFDNESPRHPEYLREFRIRSTLVTSGEFLEFIDAGGYHQADLWLSDGWAAVQKGAWEAPLYWEGEGCQWWQMTLRGMSPIEEHAPVIHVSYYEAEAFARWKNHRLPTEQEWETAVSEARAPLAQLFDEAWQWTRSAYQPYPGYRAPRGALGEYNGKFMCNQMVLRGGSFATRPGHSRPTYRNFFPPEARWQFSGIRLAS